MKQLEPKLSDELHEQVTKVMIELTAYNVMCLLLELQTEPRAGGVRQIVVAGFPPAARLRRGSPKRCARRRQPARRSDLGGL